MPRKRMTWNDVESRLKKIVVEQLGVEPSQATLDANFVEDLGADSLDTVELVMAVEEEFGINEIPNELAENWNTLADGIRGYTRAFPHEILSMVDTMVLSFRLRPDGSIEVVLQLEDGSWTYADGKSLLPSKLYLVTLSKWASILKQLEDVINDPKTKEEDLQKFFEEFPELIAGDEYDKVIPQATLSREDASVTWKADFVLAPINQTQFSKILELKPPSVRLTKRPFGGHLSFSAKIWNAITQLKDYGRAFDRSETRERFRLKYGTDVYKPDLHLIAGRQWDLQWLDNIRDLRRSQPVNIEDWDSLLQRLKRRYR